MEKQANPPNEKFVQSMVDSFLKTMQDVEKKGYYRHVFATPLYRPEVMRELCQRLAHSGYLAYCSQGTINDDEDPKDNGPCWCVEVAKWNLLGPTKPSNNVTEPSPPTAV